MGKFIDLVNKKFGKLTVIKRVKNQGKHIMWECECSCGSIAIVSTTGLRQGGTRSCGCLQKESVTTHGHSINGKQSTEYNSWINMRKRCYDENTQDFDIYGGRGISVCPRWNESFENFLEDMGLKPNKDMAIDRINPNGNYEPTNCRWVTVQQNNFNLRARRNKSSKYKGVSWNKALSKWHSYIQIDGERKHLGYYNSEAKAAKVYNEAAIKYFGKYAYPNEIE